MSRVKPTTKRKESAEPRPEQKFEHGQEVTWTTGDGDDSKERTGTVVGYLPAGTPVKVVLNAFGVNPINLSKPARAAVSKQDRYVVAVEGAKGIAVFTPQADAIKSA